MRFHTIWAGGCFVMRCSDVQRLAERGDEEASSHIHALTRRTGCCHGRACVCVPYDVQ
jgi:hypothetical protein